MKAKTVDLKLVERGGKQFTGKMNFPTVLHVGRE